MNSYSGSETTVTELGSKDVEGYYCVKVAIDKGVYAWRVQNLADAHSAEAGALKPMYLPGTIIPLCVIPKHAKVRLHRSPRADAVSGTVPAMETRDGESRNWVLPRHLYIHAQTNQFYEVMESDLSTRKTLGWVEITEVYPWITRQGYIINYSRGDEHRRHPVRGYAAKEDVGRPGREAFTEDMNRRRNTEPNLTGMPDGLLIGRDAEPYRGMDVVQTAIWNHIDQKYESLYLPVRHTLTPATDMIIPVAMLSETDIQELEAAAHLLYGICAGGSARVDEVREALETNWDITSKVVVGTDRRNQQFVRAYQRIQKLFPTLTAGLQLPPGASPDATFNELGERAARIAANASRILADMRRDKRPWAWVNLAELY
jgi:hypothetical protein